MGIHRRIRERDEANQPGFVGTVGRQVGAVGYLLLLLLIPLGALPPLGVAWLGFERMRYAEVELEAAASHQESLETALGWIPVADWPQGRLWESTVEARRDYQRALRRYQVHRRAWLWVQIATVPLGMALIALGMPIVRGRRRRPLHGLALAVLMSALGMLVVRYFTLSCLSPWSLIGHVLVAAGLLSILWSAFLPELSMWMLSPSAWATEEAPRPVSRTQILRRWLVVVLCTGSAIALLHGVFSPTNALMEPPPSRDRWPAMVVHIGILALLSTTLVLYARDALAQRISRAGVESGELAEAFG